MKPTRTSQPYRKGARQPGPALSAMTKGAPAFLPNPAALTRMAQRRARRKARGALARPQM